ncbi:MAG: T9SS type A sorting domain-containing protein [Bacteroidota bacterium]|nr:T9SS type A sorting domain-containing protein [Bacteroidota bacterium]
MSYLLPQNEKGKLEIFNINGQRVYEINLAEWSTMQMMNLPLNFSSGIYSCVITSDGVRANKKIAVLRE